MPGVFKCGTHLNQNAQPESSPARRYFNNRIVGSWGGGGVEGHAGEAESHPSSCGPKRKGGLRSRIMNRYQARSAAPTANYGSFNNMCLSNKRRIWRYDTWEILLIGGLRPTNGRPQQWGRPDLEVTMHGIKLDDIKSKDEMCMWLHDIGWKAPCDAQWEQIAPLWDKLASVTAERDQLWEALKNIHEMVEEDIRTDDKAFLFQIEAEARAALGPQP